MTTFEILDINNNLQVLNANEPIRFIEISQDTYFEHVTICHKPYIINSLNSSVLTINYNDFRLCFRFNKDTNKYYVSLTK